MKHARSVGLRYVTDTGPGLSLERHGTAIVIRDADGRRVQSASVLARVRALVLPPAWRDVWVAADARAHLQATGRDAAGRKQYRYHAEWTTARNETKFHRMTAFAAALPAIRRRVARDLREPSLSRAHVLATVVRLLERTHMRIGNEEYVRENGSHGLTTLRNRHVAIRGRRLQFAFKAKSGVRQTVEIHDARLARAVRRCQELPGQMLFQYLDEAGDVRSITSSDVNAYLQDITRDTFTAKDFRTWAGTLMAARALDEFGAADPRPPVAKCLVQAVDVVARGLGNTRAVSRRCYIHPGVMAAFEAGLTLSSIGAVSGPRGLLAEEAAVLKLLAARGAARAA